MTASVRPSGFLERLAGLASALGDVSDPNTDELVTTGLALVCEIVPGVRWASVTHRAGQARTVAASDPKATALDELQYDAGAGPCLAAVDGAEVVVSDFAAETRWPDFTAPVLTGRLATGSVSYPLAAVGHSATSVNLYTDLEGASEAIDQQVAEVVVPIFAIVLTAAHHRHSVRHLEIGLTTSRSIGAAVGVLMSRHNWTYEQAFQALRTASQHSHRRLRDIAADVVLIGDLPD